MYVFTLNCMSMSISVHEYIYIRVGRAMIPDIQGRVCAVLRVVQPEQRVHGTPRHGTARQIFLNAPWYRLQNPDKRFVLCGPEDEEGCTDRSLNLQN